MQRGAAVVAAAYALRRGDEGALRNLGLNLDELRALRPMAQCDRILEMILGSETHPDEYALKRASAEAALEIITATNEPQPIDVVRSFVTDLVLQQGLVELRAQRTAGADARTIAGKEKRIKAWIRAKVHSIAAPATGFMTANDIIASATSIGKSAVRILAAGT